MLKFQNNVSGLGVLFQDYLCNSYCFLRGFANTNIIFLIAVSVNTHVLPLLRSQDILTHFITFQNRGSVNLGSGYIGE